MEQKDIYGLAIALGIGLLTGLQRETAGSRIAGIRTFTLIALMGYLTGHFAFLIGNSWLIAVGLVAVALLLMMANFVHRKDDSYSAGQTTEVAALLIFVLTAYITIGNRTMVIVMGGLVAVLLYLKQPLHGIAQRMGEKDLRAIFQFAAITLIVLPVLPNSRYGPYEVWNPREIWLMVVLIVGLGLAGYFILKWVGSRKGMLVAGMLGGLISSTATTLSYARRTAESGQTALLAAFIIVVASAVSFVRIAVEIAVVAPRSAGVMIPPLLVPVAALLVMGWWLYRKNRVHQTEDIPEPSNPAELGSAITFAALYALILLAVSFAKDFFGNAGLFAVSFLSGLTDLDAINLSISNSVEQGRIEAGQGWQYILVAGMSNLLFKGALSAVIGGKVLGKYVFYAFGIAIAAALLFMLLLH